MPSPSPSPFSPFPPSFFSPSSFPPSSFSPSPFPPSTTSTPGHGNVHITLLPPSTPSFSALSYTYPLKLLPSSPHILKVKGGDESSGERLLEEGEVPLLFLLTYGGGLLAGDCIHLTIRLDSHTRLTIATQGSTKVYKNKQFSPPLPSDSSLSTTPAAVFQFPTANAPPSIVSRSISRQDLRVRIAAGAALWLGPDPVQPFAGSRYAQTQIFEVEPGGSVGLVDWVTEGRNARGESWAMDGWRGRNEIWEVRRVAGKVSASAPLGIETEKAEDDEKEHKILKIRDSLILQRDSITGLIPSLSPSSQPSSSPIGVLGTVLLHGPLFAQLSTFLLSEFSLLPRIGGRNWEDDTHHPDAAPRPRVTAQQRWRTQRQEQEKQDGMLWTAAKVRGGTTVVKFSAREVEGGRNWLREMLRVDGEGWRGEEGGGREEAEGREEERKERRGIKGMFGDGGMMFLR